MQTRTFGRLGWPVSAVGHGLWGMGGWLDSNDDESLAALDRSLELGCNYYDTALAYGDGKSERLLREALAQRPRQDVFIATKIPPKNLTWPADPSMPLDDVFPADHVRKATEESLTNLGLDSMDLQQFHVWTDAWTADERWQRAVDDLKREGLIRGFGISAGRRDPASVVGALRTGLVDAVQVVYNVFSRVVEDELFAVCQELGVAVVARVPFDEGSLTGTLRAGQTWPDGDFRNDYFGGDKLADTLARVDRLRAELPADLPLPEAALRFVLASPAVSTVIPGMRKRQHVDANLAVASASALDADVLGALRGHRWDR